MPTAFPHPQRQTFGQDVWLEEDSTSTTLYPGGITTFRAEWPPSFLDVNAEDLHRNDGQPVVSSNLMDLNDIRHQEIVFSAVPQIVEAPARYPTRRRSRSPASVASSSTTTVLISAGQLP